MVNLKAPLRDLRKKVNFFDESDVSSRCGERISPLPSLFLRHMLAGADYAIRAVQELVGHNDVSTTMIYTHVLNRPGINVKSPLDV